MAGSDRGGLGLGYEYGALIFGAGLIVRLPSTSRTKIPRTMLVWASSS
ncbi:hypothetical protein PQR42_32820 [Paraburkholderia sediminicola]